MPAVARPPWLGHRPGRKGGREGGAAPQSPSTPARSAERPRPPRIFWGPVPGGCRARGRAETSSRGVPASAAAFRPPPAVCVGLVAVEGPPRLLGPVSLFWEQPAVAQEVECFRRVNEGRVRPASGGGKGGIHGFRGASGGVPARGPGVSPDLCPRARPSPPVCHPPETLQCGGRPASGGGGRKARRPGCLGRRAVRARGPGLTPYPVPGSEPGRGGRAAGGVVHAGRRGARAAGPAGLPAGSPTGASGQGTSSPSLAPGRARCG